MRAGEYIGRHAALLVPRIETAAEHLHGTLGLEFRPVARIPFTMRGSGEELNQEVRACYAVDGVLELVETTPRGAFAPPVRPGVHHFGGVVTDLEAAIEEQREAGNEVDWELLYEEQLIAVFFSGTLKAPGRLELVTSQAPPLLELFTEAQHG